MDDGERKRAYGGFARRVCAGDCAGAQAGVLRSIAADGTTIFDERAERAVAPASVQKLVVAASALDALGPRTAFTRCSRREQGIGDDGALDGDLWLVGSGDPSLQSADLRNGIGVLARSGCGGSTAAWWSTRRR